MNPTILLILSPIRRRLRMRRRENRLQHNRQFHRSSQSQYRQRRLKVSANHRRLKVREPIILNIKSVWSEGTSSERNIACVQRRDFKTLINSKHMQLKTSVWPCIYFNQPL